jgi:hypothetical protein
MYSGLVYKLLGIRSEIRASIKVFWGAAGDLYEFSHIQIFYFLPLLLLFPSLKGQGKVGAVKPNSAAKFKLKF